MDTLLTAVAALTIPTYTEAENMPCSAKDASISSFVYNYEPKKSIGKKSFRDALLLVVQDAFVQGAKFAEIKRIPLKEKEPKNGDTVIFWIVSSDKYDNGRIAVGRYHGLSHGHYEFSTPGVGWWGSHWAELPDYLNIKL